MRSRLGSTTAVIGTLILVLAGVPFAPSQPQNPPASPNPTVFRAQLTEASILGKRTLRELQSLPADESTPVDPTVVNHARQTYVLIRAASHGMGLLQERQQNRSFKDPALELAGVDCRDSDKGGRRRGRNLAAR